MKNREYIAKALICIGALLSISGTPLVYLSSEKEIPITDSYGHQTGSYTSNIGAQVGYGMLIIGPLLVLGSFLINTKQESTPAKGK